jgi:hypothetical protein
MKDQRGGLLVGRAAEVDGRSMQLVRLGCVAPLQERIFSNSNVCSTLKASQRVPDRNDACDFTTLSRHEANAGLEVHARWLP